MSSRISFQEAIAEPLLFKKSFEVLSKPQQAILKFIYGLPITKEEKIYWDAFNGFGLYDDLGYLIGTSGEFPYVPREMTDITLIVGRRSGKTSAVSSFVVAYEALCGGHKDYLGKGSRQDPVFLQVCQDLATAKDNIRQFILDILEKSPVGKATLGDVKLSVTADMIRLKGCGRIVVGAPTIKLRGQAIAICAMDELAVWPKDRESSNPDSEVERSVTPAMLQFPQKKLIKTSTPMTEEGLLWKATSIGTYGQFIGFPNEHKTTLVLRSPTAAFENPIITRGELQKEKLKDPEAFGREFLAQFSKSVSGFLSTHLLRQSVVKGVRERQPKNGQLYVAALDPAFRGDAFAFCIGHMENGKFLLDVMQSWRGTPEQPISPSMVLALVADYCKRYGIKSVVSDQHHLDSLQELAGQHNLSIEPCIFTANVKKVIWSEFASMLNQERLSLLDHTELLEECMALEKHITQAGTMQFYGKRDDHATVCALCLHRVLQFGERLVKEDLLKPILHEDLFWQNFKKTHGKKSTEGSPWWA